MTNGFAKVGVIAMTVLTLAGCANMTKQQQRMLSGGALGAAGGAIIAGVAGGGMLAGAAIGAAGGAAVGAMSK